MQRLFYEERREGADQAMPPESDDMSDDNGSILSKAKHARGKRLEIRRLRLKKNSVSYENMANTSNHHMMMLSPSSSSTTTSRDNNNVAVAKSLHSYGCVSVCGRRREMEDTVRVELGEKYDFFGVYDGHGGAKVAQMCRDRLHKILAEEIVDGGGGGDEMEFDWEKVMKDCFAKMDEEINVSCEEEERQGSSSSSMKSVGSTAVVAVVENRKLVVVNCGDSRAVLSRGGVAIPLSQDHKPDRSDEMERVEAAGGRVIIWNGYRVLGVLATSRSLGDYYLKPYVISEPDVTITEQSNTDEFLILASDGLWDVMSNKLACNIARRCLHGNGLATRFHVPRRIESETSNSMTSEAAAVLVELAMAKGSSDNISVVVVELKKSSSFMC